MGSPAPMVEPIFKLPGQACRLFGHSAALLILGFPNEQFAPASRAYECQNCRQHYQGRPSGDQSTREPPVTRPLWEAAKMRVDEIVYHAMIEQEMAEAAGTHVRAAWDPVAQVWFTTWS